MDQLSFSEHFYSCKSLTQAPINAGESCVTHNSTFYFSVSFHCISSKKNLLSCNNQSIKLYSVHFSLSKYERCTHSMIKNHRRDYKSIHVGPEFQGLSPTKPNQSCFPSILIETVFHANIVQTQLFFSFLFLQRKAFCLSGLYYEGQTESTRLLSQRVSPWCSETKSSPKREGLLGHHHGLPTGTIYTHTVKHWSVHDKQIGGKRRA